MKANMVSHYLCNELNALGPTARTDVDTWERVQQRPPGWSGAVAQGIWVSWRSWRREGYGGSLLSAAPWRGSREDRARVFSELHSKRIIFCQIRGVILCHEGDQAVAQESEEAMGVLPWWYWKSSWTRKVFNTLSWLGLWPCFRQEISTRLFQPELFCVYGIYIILSPIGSFY